MVDINIAVNDLTTEQLTEILRDTRVHAQRYQEVQDEIKNRAKIGEDIDNNIISANTYIIKGRCDTSRQIEYLTQQLKEASKDKYMAYMAELAKETFKTMGTIGVKIKFKE